MKKIILLACIISAYASLYADCLRENRKHENKYIVHCTYLQRDIYREFAENPGKHKEAERYKRCFYCGCKIEEHTKILNEKKPKR